MGLVGLSGPYALEPDSKILNTIFASPYTEADWQPVRFVTPQAPPTLLVHGTADDVVSIRHAEKLRDVLQANHVRVETQFYPGKSARRYRRGLFRAGAWSHAGSGAQRELHRIRHRGRSCCASAVRSLTRRRSFSRSTMPSSSMLTSACVPARIPVMMFVPCEMT